MTTLTSLDELGTGAPPLNVTGSLVTGLPDMLFEVEMPLQETENGDEEDSTVTVMPSDAVTVNYVVEGEEVRHPTNVTFLSLSRGIK